MILTQANWLKMPSRASLDPSPAMGTTLLKRHKILPHPRPDPHFDMYSYVPPQKPRVLTIDTGAPSTPGSSDTSSPPTLKHASKRIGAPELPPTPPAHSRVASENPSTVTSGPKSSANSIPGTPVTHNSPPTPDVTPPRHKPPLAFRPATDRYPSSHSRTDSFKTARETPYCSDEDEVSTVRPKLPSARPSDNEVQRMPHRIPKPKVVGLGLGLESDEGSQTPILSTDSQAEFVVFDGEWGSTDELYEVEREWDDNLMRNVTVRKRPKQKPYNFTDGQEVLEDDIVTPTAATKAIRSLSLQERIAKHRLEKEEKQTGDRVAWTPRAEAEAGAENPSTPDLRRFSAMSSRSVSSSTIIEALVVDAPPMRRKTLRHTKKCNGLRNFSDQSIRSSAPSSDLSHESHHKFIHNTSKFPDRGHRSLASNTTASTVSSRSSSGKSRRQVVKSGGIPVVVIPDRQSSTRSSKAPSLRSTSSRKTKRSLSLSSAPLSNSSKFNDPAFSRHLPRQRTMSESAGSGHSERTIDFPPDIPARRSSLSAPTSRNTSRAGSLTAESLKAHDMMMEAKKQVGLKADDVPLQPSVESQKAFSQSSRLNVDHDGDPVISNRQSTQVTPFSQLSYDTAGTMAEVSEAMAVAIFPHQNTSVLMVQQQGAAPQPSPSSNVIPQPQISVNGKGPVTPPQKAHPMDEVDSPLRNPRQPPIPPAIKFIPPTPSGLTPGDEEEKQLGFEDERPSSSDSRTKRTMSLMRRAFSNRRRNSEPVIMSSNPGLIKRTFSLNGRRKQPMEDFPKSEGNEQLSSIYPSVEDQPADTSKLHPFWRPAHFWDDLEDNDSADDDDFGRYPIIDNRPAPKRNLSDQLKRTFAILPIRDDDDDRYYEPYAVDRRSLTRSDSGRMRVMKQRSNSSLKREMSNRRRYIEDDRAPDQRFGYGFKEGNGGRVHTIPGLGIRVEYVGWNNMKRRLSERRRKERNEKLRASISTPKGVQNGVDDILRRKSQVL